MGGARLGQPNGTSPTNFPLADVAGLRVELCSGEAAACLFWPPLRRAVDPGYDPGVYRTAMCMFLPAVLPAMSIASSCSRAAVERVSQRTITPGCTEDNCTKKVTPSPPIFSRKRLGYLFLQAGRLGARQGVVRQGPSSAESSGDGAPQQFRDGCAERRAEGSCGPAKRIDRLANRLRGPQRAGRRVSLK